MTTPPVLCYHRIGGPPELGVTRVSAAVFERQMRALVEGGWRTLTLPAFAESLRTTHHAPRTFLLTFDDGYASLAEHAYPVLADLGFTATTFLITDYIGQANTWDVRYTWRRLHHLDWAAVERLQAAGFDFGSHSASHPRLTWLRNAQIADELARSRSTLVARLGAEAGRAVAYPFAAVDDRVAGLARSAGYDLGFGGPSRVADSWRLARTPVYVWDAGGVPAGLRDGFYGKLGRGVATLANRCAVGTSVMLGFKRRMSGS